MMEYKSAKRRLRSTINKSKARYWQDLVDEVNEDPWGLGYKLVTRKIGALRKPCSLKAEQMDPIDPIWDGDVGAESADDCPLFSIRELEQAVLSIKAKKAAGPNGIPAEVDKLVFQNRSDLLLSAFNACLKEGAFPVRWKVARLALIHKEKGDPELPSSYRPLCMLHTAVKALQRLIRSRRKANSAY